MTVLRAPLAGVVHTLEVAVGDILGAGTLAVVLESMKMHHEVRIDAPARVDEIYIEIGQALDPGDPMIGLAPADHQAAVADAEAAVTDLEALRPDLVAVIERTARTADDARADAVAKRHSRGQRTARENIDDLCDPGSFQEYGRFAVAAQRSRRTEDDLEVATAADGIVVGTASVNGDDFGPEAARTAVLAYDYTVLAGTQGFFGHDKTDRLLELARDQRMPVVFYCEGGGGRPGDVDVDRNVWVAGLHVPTFATYASMSGLVPRIGIAAGRCFAGNAALFGCSDVTIATRDSNVGMGGPAMIEGGGLGVHRPEEIGPIDVMSANGVVDLVADDEVHATELTRRVLSYFQGRLPRFGEPDQRALRHVVPEDRQRVYDIRAAIDLVADLDSVLELRAGYGAGMVTAFVRIEGEPYGLIANDPRHLGGAIDAEAATKAARFLQLCDAFDIPIISLCDTPGFMVGPESEEQAAVRRVSSLFVAGATLSVPLFFVCLRKGYGLGAQAMAGGGFRQPVFTVAWPTGEFGGMGLEGAVRLGYRKELAEQPDDEAREALFAKLVASAYEKGKAIRMATALEIDAVIDPAETRRWIVRGRQSLPTPPPRTTKKRPFVDTW